MQTPSVPASGGRPAVIARPVRLCALAGAPVLAALQAVAYRNLINPDGLSYLDVARAFANWDFDRALNPHWGPLYPAALAVGFAIAAPDASGVIPAIHAVNFVAFLAALAAFDFFLRELLRGRERAAAAAAFGYAVFVYAALGLNGLKMVTPDLLVMASVFGAAGVVLRTVHLGPTTGRAATLGAVLAVGYFAKSVMFVLGVGFIGGLLFLPGARRPWRAIATAAAVFFALAALLVVPFSRRTGTPTFGTAGKLAYNWEVNRVPYTNWQGDAHSKLEHPPRRLHAAPDLFEYTGHLEGTYPPWSDPAYWNAGTKVPFRLRSQVRQLYESAKFYGTLFFGGAGAVASVLAVLAAGRGLRGHLALLLPALGALALYTPVHLEARYVAPFAALLWILPVATARRAPGDGSLPGRGAALAALVLVGPVAFRTVTDLWKWRHGVDPHSLVAAELHRLGLRPGDRVANVGVVRGENFGSSFEGYWAYLAGVHIAAEVPEHRGFICADTALAGRLFAAMAAVGARAVVTRAIPSEACTAGWHRVPRTDFYIRPLAASPRTSNARDSADAE